MANDIPDIILPSTPPFQKSGTFQSAADAYGEDFLDRIIEIHWPEPSGSIISVGWSWQYEFNFTSPPGPACFSGHPGGPPCYDFIFPDSAAGAFCGWGQTVKVGTDLGGTPPAKTGPTIFGLPYTHKLFPVVGHPFASDNISLPADIYASAAWTQAIVDGAPSAPHFEAAIPGQPLLGGAFVYRGKLSAGGTQVFWGKPIQQFAIGYWISQSEADFDAEFPTTCIFQGAFANGWITTINDDTPLGGSIEASMSGTQYVTLSPPGVTGARTKKPINYELYQTRIVFSINNTNGAFTGHVGSVQFFLDYKVRGSKTPPIGRNINP